MMCQIHGGFMEPLSSWRLYEQRKSGCCVHCIRDVCCDRLKSINNAMSSCESTEMLRRIAGTWPRFNNHLSPAAVNQSWLSDFHGNEIPSENASRTSRMSRRNPTSFSIADILGKRTLEDQSQTSSRTIVRPWDNEVSCSDRGRSNCSENRREPETNETDEEEETDAGQDGAKSTSRLLEMRRRRRRKTDCPLDALLRMTTRTQFDRMDNITSGYTSDDSGADGHHFPLPTKSIFLQRSSHPVKKRRKTRTAFTNHQIFHLEKRFIYQKYLTPADRDELAVSLRLSNSQVITWFQNRRAKLKRDLEELRADVTAAKALGTEPSTVVLSRLDELLKANDNSLRKKDKISSDIHSCRPSPTNQNSNAASSSSSSSSSCKLDDSTVTTTVHDLAI